MSYKIKPRCTSAPAGQCDIFRLFPAETGTFDRGTRTLRFRPHVIWVLLCRIIGSVEKGRSATAHLPRRDLAGQDPFELSGGVIIPPIAGSFGEPPGLRCRVGGAASQYGTERRGSIESLLPNLAPVKYCSTFSGRLYYPIYDRECGQREYRLLISFGTRRVGVAGYIGNAGQIGISFGVWTLLPR